MLYSGIFPRVVAQIEYRTEQDTAAYYRMHSRRD
jgi:hypothetical protein